MQQSVTMNRAVRLMGRVGIEHGLPPPLSAVATVAPSAQLQALGDDDYDGLDDDDDDDDDDDVEQDGS